MCISTEHLQNSSHALASMATAEAGLLEQHELLALYILYEYHDPGGPWAPYLCLLPRKLTRWAPFFMRELGMPPSQDDMFFCMGFADVHCFALAAQSFGRPGCL